MWNKNISLPSEYAQLTVLYSINSICSRAISVLNALICWLALSWFTINLFLMFRALLAYFSVFKVSMKSRSDGLMQAIIIVWLTSERHSHDCDGSQNTALVNVHVFYTFQWEVTQQTCCHPESPVRAVLVWSLCKARGWSVYFCLPERW